MYTRRGDHQSLTRSERHGRAGHRKGTHAPLDIFFSRGKVRGDTSRILFLIHKHTHVSVILNLSNLKFVSYLETATHLNAEILNSNLDVKILSYAIRTCNLKF